MDNNGRNQTPEDKIPSEELAIVPPKLPIASISFSLSSIFPIPTHFLPSPTKVSSIFSPSKVKIPTQISSLSHLTLASSIAPSKSSLKSTFSAKPLQSPLPSAPLRPAEPSSAAGLRRASIVWFRNDLRAHDNECLNSANSESMSVLPVYCFDPRDYGKSSSGFDKTGPYRATFLLESVADLRKTLQSKGSDLVIRIGKPEVVLLELAQAIGAEAVYAQREVSHDEVKAEDDIENAMKEEGMEVKYFWGSTLYHLEDLPFELSDMPTNYGGFKEKVQRLEVRKTIEALDQLKGLPSRGDVEPGEMPTLADLGLNSNANMLQNGKSSVNGTLVGGETQALERLRRFAAECQAQPHKGNPNESIYGANFSCKISPWLAMGCISPRSMFEELKKTVSKTISAASGPKIGGNGSSDTGMNWLMYELMWRDFFRFITKKYSNAKLHNAAPVTACTVAAA